MLYYERKFKRLGFDIIIGVDEAGRGPLAGPVVAAAVALKTFRFKNRIDDSKKLTALARERASFEIIQKSSFGIGLADEKVIDQFNILAATAIAIKKAIGSLLGKLRLYRASQMHIIVDGNMTLDLDFPYTSIIRGDAKSKSIAAASILAKVTRDRMMLEYDLSYPQYGFARHKGYPTAEHRKILAAIGLCPIHRKTFCGV
jgi:ribonuclease HII